MWPTLFHVGQHVPNKLFCLSRGSLGLSWGSLGALLGLSWGLFGSLGLSLGLSWALLGLSWGSLGALLASLGALLGLEAT